MQHQSRGLEDHTLQNHTYKIEMCHWKINVSTKSPKQKKEATALSLTLADRYNIDSFPTSNLLTIRKYFLQLHSVIPKCYHRHDHFPKPSRRKVLLLSFVVRFRSCNYLGLEMAGLTISPSPQC